MTSETRMITKSEYERALEIVRLYEDTEYQKRLSKIDKLKEELNEYFRNNIVSGRKIKSVYYDIRENNRITLIPDEPYFEESYYDENSDKDIKEIGEKYGESVKWIYYVYGK